MSVASTRNKEPIFENIFPHFITSSMSGKEKKNHNLFPFLVKSTKIYKNNNVTA